MARVPPRVRDALLGVLRDAGLDAQAGDALYPPRNWHQTLSDLYPPAAREALLRACGGLEAAGFDLHLDRLACSASERIHWQFVPSGGRPDGLARLSAALRARLRAQGLEEKSSHRAHVTVSYNASRVIEPLAFAPLCWPIDAIELVEVAGRGRDYRYEVVEAWPLSPPAARPPGQLDLLL